MKHKIMILVFMSGFFQLGFAGIKIQNWEGQIFNKNKEAVVNISIEDSYQISGFFVSNNGYIITESFSALHLPLEKDKITITTASGYKFKPSFITTNTKLQITLLKIDAEVKHFFQLANDPLDAGNELVIIGATSSQGWQRKLVTIENINNNIITYSREGSMPGFSGAPIINKNGRVVGIHKGSSSKNSEINTKQGEGFTLDGVVKYIYSLEGITLKPSIKLRKK